MTREEQLEHALILAKSCHGKMLLTDPPQDAWKYHSVDEAIDEALSVPASDTRAVKVAQLERWHMIIDKLAPGFVYGSGPYNETLPEMTGMWREIRAIISRGVEK